MVFESRNLSINLYLRLCCVAVYKSSICTVCVISDFFLVCKLCKFGFLITNYILEKSRYTNNVYIEVYLVLTQIKRLFSTVCYLLSYFFCSVNHMSWVSKFHNFFWHAQKLGQGVYLKAFSIVIYGKFISNFSVPF